MERKFGLGVVICVFNSDFSKILLLKRNAEKGHKWGNVGGRVELGETLAEACAREAEEEIGLAVAPMFIDIKESPHLTEVHHAIHFVYAAVLDGSEKIVLNDESENYGWFDFDSLPDTLDSKEDLVRYRELARKVFMRKS